MGHSTRAKGRSRDLDRRLERHRINAAGIDPTMVVRHGYGRSVTVSTVQDSDMTNPEMIACDDAHYAEVGWGFHDNDN